jgi:hypothetical protein
VDDIVNFKYCSWVNSEEDCEDYFSPILTEEGICFTANMLNAEDIFTDNV